MRLLLLGFSSLLLATAAPRIRGDHVDPPLRLVLLVDGQEHQLVDGQEATLSIDGKPQKVRVSVASTRRFDAAGVQFEFPRDMSVDFGASEALQTWTLDGSDTVVTIHRQATAQSPLAADILGSQAEALGAKVDAPTAIELNLGGTAHGAFETRLRFGEARLHMRAIDLELGDGTLTIVVQDSGTDDGGTSVECQRVLDLLATTFVVTGAK